MAIVGEVVYEIRAEIREFVQNMNKTRESVDRVQRSVDSAGKSLNTLLQGAQAVTGALAGVAGLGMFGGMIKSAVMAAARNQVLATSLKVTAENAGYTREEIVAYEKQIRGLGVSIDETRNTMQLFIQSNLSLADAAKLTRAAQNLAAGTFYGSSEALGVLTHAIVTGNAMVLQQFGIVATADQIWDKYAKTHRKVRESLTETDKKTAILNFALEASKKKAGAYEASMKDVGKLLGSFTSRTIPDFLAVMGTPYQSVFLDGISLLYKWGQAYINASSGVQRLISILFTSIGAFTAVGAAVLALRAAFLLLGLSSAAAATGIVAPWVAIGGILVATVFAFWDEVKTVWTSAQDIISAKMTLFLDNMKDVIVTIGKELKALAKLDKEEFYKLEDDLNRRMAERSKLQQKTIDASMNAIKAISEKATAAFSDGLDDEQKIAREKLRALGLMDKAMLEEIRKRHGKALTDFVKEKEEEWIASQGKGQRELQLEADLLEFKLKSHQITFESFKKSMNALIAVAEKGDDRQRAFALRLREKLLEEDKRVKEVRIKELDALLEISIDAQRLEGEALARTLVSERERRRAAGLLTVEDEQQLNKRISQAHMQGAEDRKRIEADLLEFTESRYAKEVLLLDREIEEILKKYPELWSDAEEMRNKKLLQLRMEYYDASRQLSQAYTEEEIARVGELLNSREYAELLAFESHKRWLEEQVELHKVASRTIYDFYTDLTQEAYTQLSGTLTNILTRQTSISQGFKDLAKGMLRFIAGWVSQWLVAKALGHAFQASAVATTTAAAAAMSAVLVGPAILATIASFGEAAIAAPGLVAAAVLAGSGLVGGIQAGASIAGAGGGTAAGGATLSGVEGTAAPETAGVAVGAEGGLITKPTILLAGEKGPEALIPLTGQNAPAQLGNVQVAFNVYGDINTEADIDGIMVRLGDTVRKAIRSRG